MNKLKFKKRLLSGLRRKLDQRSGIMLLVVLWMLVILTVLSVSLGRNTNIELALTKHAIAQAKAKYYAFAGIEFSKNLIRLDSKDKQSLSSDNLYSCAVPNLSGISPEGLFKRNEMGSGYFSVRHEVDDDHSQEHSRQYYGLSDEDGRININALDKNTVSILRELIVLKGLDRDVANTVAFSAVDWVDSDTIVFDESYGAEDDHYSSLDKPYHCKNLSLDSKEEMLLIRGMTPEIFNEIKDNITIFPKNGRLLVNFDTASAEVLLSIARSVAGGSTNAELSDADSAVEKLIAFRKGDDGLEATEDDKLYDLNKISLNAKEKSVLMSISRYRSKRSDYINVNVVGVEKKNNIQSKINAVIYRNDLSLVYWNRS
ncbi:MAG: general secretion pathway protein GspK [Candidatus Omnitrophica bacterium]|nr:general secretion pathway protein GspK [Candidatus Omnitrophota bacterium]MBU1996517.1 general secretion pathway protein GspK [Candidatus Omnitrophota bacterium]